MISIFDRDRQAAAEKLTDHVTRMQEAALNGDTVALSDADYLFHETLVLSRAVRD